LVFIRNYTIIFTHSFIVLRKKYSIFQKEYWGNNVSLWSRSYFVASVGGAPIEILKEYIENQKAPD